MDAASAPDSECPMYLMPVSPEENAPEVVPSSVPILAQPEYEEKQLARDDSPKFLTVLDEVCAVAFAGHRMRSKRKVWIISIACAILVVVLTVSVVLGVHFGKRNDNANDTTASDSSIISASPTTSTISPDSTTRASSSSLATSVALSTSSTVSTSHSTTATIAATSATPTDAAADDLGCYEQGNPDKQIPLCAQPSCPAGYRSVFWDFGCPNGKWKCCI